MQCFVVPQADTSVRVHDVGYDFAKNVAGWRGISIPGSRLLVVCHWHVPESCDFAVLQSFCRLLPKCLAKVLLWICMRVYVQLRTYQAHSRLIASPHCHECIRQRARAASLPRCWPPWYLPVVYVSILQSQSVPQDAAATSRRFHRLGCPTLRLTCERTPRCLHCRPHLTNRRPGL